MPVDCHEIGANPEVGRNLFPLCPLLDLLVKRPQKLFDVSCSNTATDCRSKHPHHALQIVCLLLGSPDLEETWLYFITTTCQSQVNRDAVSKIVYFCAN